MSRRVRPVGWKTKKTMSVVIDLSEKRQALIVKRAYRNWGARFGEDFGVATCLSGLSLQTLTFLAQGKEKGTFYIYELIMTLQGMGSGFEFADLSPKNKMDVIDQYLFILDRIRFECMKRLGWIEAYPGEDYPLVEMVLQFDRVAPGLQAEIPRLSAGHPGYDEYRRLSTFDREAFVRKLIPKALKAIQSL